MNYVNQSYYDPSAIVDDIIANCDAIVLFDSASTDFATIVSGEIHTYTPNITKVAIVGGGFKAVSGVLANQTATGSGDVNHWAMLDTVNSKVLVVGEGAGDTLTSGEPFNIPSFASHYAAMSSGS